MGNPRVDEKTFISLLNNHGIAETARRLKLKPRAVYARRRDIEDRLGRAITVPDMRSTRVATEHPQRAQIEVKNGHVLIGSDAHYWPGEASTAHRAFVEFCKQLKPKAVIFNGDAFDGASISRHPPMNWEDLPTVQEEIEAVQERLSEIEKAAFKAEKVWTLGNHDGRFEARLAQAAPEFAKVHGVHLKDHFPQWRGAWSAWVNDVVVKHRFKGGIHATHNATMWAGKSMVTGHLHSLKVTPFTDYNGTRYGVDTGCLADPHGPQFDYAEDNPKNHRSGFIVLTFHDGRLLWPEVVSVFDKNSVEFRGEIIRV